MKKGFTLAEVLITLAIIGVVAAISIPSVISNSQQSEFKTGLRKAISVLNSAITMNIALDGETPYDNANLFGYLMKHMSVVSSFSDLHIDKFFIDSGNGLGYWTNAAFYTTDGMRFEFWRYNGGQFSKFRLYESNVLTCLGASTGDLNLATACGGCGSYGLNNNIDKTTKPPCMITVDVNGDRKPNPANASCKHKSCSKPYKYADPKGTRLSDMFTIMITDKQAIPYGIAAQKAMYQAQKKN